MHKTYIGGKQMCSGNHHCGPDNCSCRGGKIERFIEPCILLLLKKKQPTHGYDLMEELTAFGIDNDPGALYRTLRRLENEQMVSSQWDTSGTGPAKRLYELTPAGEELLNSWVVNFKYTQERIANFIKMHEKLMEE